jgi:hypothetical protein
VFEALYAAQIPRRDDKLLEQCFLDNAFRLDAGADFIDELAVFGLLAVRVRGRGCGG